jgi:hypothetical protein
MFFQCLNIRTYVVWTTIYGDIRNCVKFSFPLTTHIHRHCDVTTLRSLTYLEPSHCRAKENDPTFAELRCTVPSWSSYSSFKGDTSLRHRNCSFHFARGLASCYEVYTLASEQCEYFLSRDIPWHHVISLDAFLYRHSHPIPQTYCLDVRSEVPAAIKANSTTFWLLNGCLFGLLLESDNVSSTFFWNVGKCSMNTVMYYISMTYVILFTTEVSYTDSLMH